MPDSISALAAVAAPAAPSASGFSSQLAPVIPSGPVPTTQTTQTTSANSLQTAVNAISAHFDSQGSQVRFRIDQDTHRLVVSVLDAANGAVLIQIPSQDALDIAKSIERTRAALVQRLA